MTVFTKITLFTIVMLFSSGCIPPAVSGERRATQEMPMSNLFESDLLKLKQLIQLDVTPQSVRWQTFQKGTESASDLGPTDWSLMAILEMDGATLQVMQGKLAATPMTNELFVEPKMVQDWFPEAVRSSFTPDTTGQYLTITQPLYLPEIFVKSPLSNGYAFIAGNYLFLYLDTV